MLTVCILPVIENINNFAMLLDKIKNVQGISVCQEKDIQCASDGVWKCDGNSIELRDSTKKEMLNKRTLQPATQDEIDNTPELVQEYDAWVLHALKSKYYFHPKSGITQEDIDKQAEIGQQDYGNGMTSPFMINGKLCTLLVLNDGVTLTQAQKDFIEVEFAR